MSTTARLCFNCNEKFSRGHNRVCQHLFFLDIAEATDIDDPLVSLHAIAGVRTGEMMQLHISLGGATCKV